MQKENLTQMDLQVTSEVVVKLMPFPEHEFLMTTKEVAHGYGISEYTLRRHKMSHSEELIDGKHFITAVHILNGGSKIPPNATLWTKRGIVRLGFFIKSERAKLFRDWAEELIIKIDEQKDLFGQSVQSKTLPEPKKRNHNRLTAERLLDIMADVVKIEDEYLRLKITKKLGL